MEIFTLLFLATFPHQLTKKPLIQTQQNDLIYGISFSPVFLPVTITDYIVPTLAIKEHPSK